MEDKYHELRLKEIERYRYYSVHGDIVIVTTQAPALTAMSVHGTIIMAPTTEEVSVLLKQCLANRRRIK